MDPRCLSTSNSSESLGLCLRHLHCRDPDKTANREPASDRPYQGGLTHTGTLTTFGPVRHLRRPAWRAVNRQIGSGSDRERLSRHGQFMTWRVDGRPSCPSNAVPGLPECEPGGVGRGAGDPPGDSARLGPPRGPRPMTGSEEGDELRRREGGPPQDRTQRAGSELTMQRDHNRAPMPASFTWLPHWQTCS